MRIILESVDGAVYGDLILNPQEKLDLMLGEIIDGEVTFERKKYYLGIRIQDRFDNEEDDPREEED